MTTTESSSSIYERRSYGLWQKPRSAGLFGLRWGETVLGFVVVITALLTALVAGPKPAFFVAGIGAVVMVPLVWRTGGRSGYETGLMMFHWLRGRSKGEHVYRGGRFSRVPGGAARLPGLMAPSKLYEGIDAGGYSFGMIHLPQFAQYTVVLRAWPQGHEAVDQPVIDRWVSAWGTFLASLGQTSDIIAVVPVIDTVPETGNRLLTEVSTITRSEAPDLAQQVMFELATELPQERVQLLPRVAITFKATTAERRKNPAEEAVEIGRRLPGICAAMAEAGVRAQPMSADEVIGFIRRSYDPASQADLEVSVGDPGGHGLDWADAGPISHEERWDHFLHDGGRSVTWEMDTAPEGAVDERVLQRLLAPNPEVPRKRIAIVYRPHSAADAAEIVDDDYKNALVAQQSERGVVSASATLRVGATQQAREEQARGHGVTRFGALVTITEPLRGDLPRIEAITRDLSTQARLKIRRCYRYQAAAFAASLGCGVILPEHASIPKALAG
ncbi:SCO6880 family protein [Nocardia sp. BMG51109]|uniref:SCO6880 family protein n=1 Tax=Nocardia sp. BMG51109 TaxID=1056816 RepID=UPI0004673DFF|nr:SCO6880 family protein [Nocardia sp. BMG51109]